MTKREVQNRAKKGSDALTPAPTDDLGRFLKSARLAAGLTQTQVARKLGLGSAQSISDWEGNRSGSVPVPSLRHLVKIYGMDVNALYDVLHAHQMKLLEDKMKELRSVLKAGRSS